MATASVSYTFVNGTTGDGTQVSQNFTDVVNFLNNSVVHKDGATTMTGALTLPASDPVSANQAARKAYVDRIGVQVFASTTARDTGIPSPTDGQLCYVNSGDAAEGLWSYNGSAWRQGPGWNAPWGVMLNKKQTSGSQSITTTATVLTNLTGSVNVVNNRLYRVSLHAYYSNTTAGAVNVLAARAGGTTITGTQIVASNTVNGFTKAIVGVYQATSTAAVTFDAVISAVSGTVVSAPTGSFVNQLLVEDIGPAGAPA